jgi:hypothetical protein
VLTLPAAKVGRRPAPRSEEENMAVTFTRSIGMILLALWLILTGIAGLAAVAIPAVVMAVLALLAGILILVGR